LFCFEVGRHREADIGQEGAAQRVDLLVGHQFVGQPHRILGLAAVVAADHLELAAEHAAGGIDLLDGQLPAVAIGLQVKAGWAV
jgi:hypothetical protein